MDFNIKDLIPQHKHDIAAVNRLKNIDKMSIDIRPVIEDIFIWLQNINWPVAQELCEVLPSVNPDILIPEIRKVLNSNDDCWQFSCICFLIPNLSKEILVELQADLERIINNPTDNEKLSDINQNAQDIFERYF